MLQPLVLPNPDPRIGFASVRVSDAPFPITAGEESLITGTEAPRRQAEIRAGRHVAHLAMEALGHPPHPIYRAPSRAPVWPAGLVGSIAHDATTAVAIAASDRHFCSLGVDIEPAEPLEPDLWEALFHPEEIAVFETSDLSAGLLARAAFCTKESCYKALFPLCGLLFDFRDIRLSWSPETRRFATQSLRPDLHVPAALTTKALFIDAKILTLTTIAP